MPFTVVTVRTPEFVRLRVEGLASIKNYFDLIEDAGHDTRAHGDRRGLVDLRGVVGRLKFTDQYLIGDIIGSKLAHLKRLATLVPADPTSYNSETVARRHGVDLRTFDDESKALAWLLADPPPPEAIQPASSAK